MEVSSPNYDGQVGIDGQRPCAGQPGGKLQLILLGVVGFDHSCLVQFPLDSGFVVLNGQGRALAVGDVDVVVPLVPMRVIVKSPMAV